MSMWSKLSDGGSWMAYALMGVSAAAVSIVLYTQASSGRPSFKEVYFYNIDTESLVPMRADAVPPVVLDDGTRAVRAYTYECPSCVDPDGILIAYVERYSDDAHVVRSKYPIGTSVPYEEAGPLMSGDSRLVATVEMAAAGEWVSLTSGRGEKISRSADLILDYPLVPKHP